MVAAQGIVALGIAVAPSGGAEIPRVPAVVEDDFLIEFAQIGHQPKISFTLSNAGDQRVDIGSVVL